MPKKTLHSNTKCNIAKTGDGLAQLIAGHTASGYRYEGQGSLALLPAHTSVGSLMGSLNQSSRFIECMLVRMVHWALHKRHQLALGGVNKTALITRSEMIDRAHRPRIKLH